MGTLVRVIYHHTSELSHGSVSGRPLVLALPCVPGSGKEYASRLRQHLTVLTTILMSTGCRQGNVLSNVQLSPPSLQQAPPLLGGTNGT